MPARKKTIKKKSTRSSPQRKSKFSLKRILAPFLVLVAVAGILSFTLLPKSGVLSSQTAAGESSFGQKLSLYDGGYLKIPISNTDSFNQALCRTRSVEFILEPNMKEVGGNGADILNRWVAGNNGGVNGPYVFFLNSNKNLVAGVKGSSSNNAGATITSKTVFEPGSSHHIALEYLTLGSDTSKQGLYLFIDGKLEGFDSSGQGNIYCPKGGELNISSVGTPFTGTIDELRFSTIPRYAPKNSFVRPTAPFVSDAYTSGLWHFDGNLKDESQLGRTFQPVGKYVFNNITPTPSQARCGNITLESYKVFEGCGNGTYKKSDFMCTDGFGYTIPSSTCKTQAQFKQEAYDICQTRTATCISTPAPTTVPYLSPAPTRFPTLTKVPTRAPTVTPTMAKVKMCQAKLSYVNTKTACKPFKSGSTTGMSFGCSDGYVGTKTGATCMSAAAWHSVALRECGARMTPCK